MDEWQIGDSRFLPSGRGQWRRPERLLALAAVPAVLAGFLAGYWWHSSGARAQREGVDRARAVSAATWTAVDAIDEAVRAKYEKRASGALSALDRARRADPAVPGLEVVFAEIAFDEKQFAEMRVAAAEAKKKSDHAAAANVLLGMDKWRDRGRRDREMAAAADSACVYFDDAAEEDFFAAQARFFGGDVLRYAGREKEGGRRALSALHRFGPWDSSDVIAAKAILASAEAGDVVLAGLAFIPDSPWACAVSETAKSSKPRATAALADLAPFAAQPTLRAVAADWFFGSRQAQGLHWPLLP